MPLASTWFDPVIGLDIHFEIVPLVPAPVPFPHPFVGLVFDPVGLLLGLAISNAIGLATGAQTGLRGPVLINGLPATTTGTVAINWILLPHFPFPPGIMWAPFFRVPKPPVRPGDVIKPELPIPPPGDSIIITGSKTVHILGTNAARLGDIGLSCSDPIRLPLSFILAVPKGAPVDIGGPMGLDFLAAVLCVLRTQWIQNRIRSFIERLTPARLRNVFSRVRCFFTGHPVDVATGRMMTSATDWSLPALAPLPFERVYASSWSDRGSPFGFGWSHPYDQAVWTEPGKVVYRAGDGREIEFDVFERPGHVLRPGEHVFDPVSRCTLHHQGEGRYRVEEPDGLVVELAPIPGDTASRARVTRLHVSGRRAVQCVYDDRGHLRGLVGPGGGLAKLDVDGEGRITRISLPDPADDGWVTHATYVYSADGDLVEVHDALGQVTRYAYEDHLMVQETDRTGLSFYFGYDGRGPNAYCVCTWGDGGIFHRVLDYDKAGRVTWVTDSLGARTIYRMNEALAVVEVEDAAGQITRLAYDDDLRLTSITDPLGHQTRYEHDERGARTRVSMPDGGEIRAERDATGRWTRIVNGAGAEWRSEYDAAGHPSARVDPLGRRTRIHHDRGRIVAVDSPEGARVSLEYDTAGNLVRRRAAAGHETRFTYDRLGRLTSLADAASGRAFHLRRDALGRVVAIDDPLGRARSFQHDAEGRVVAAEDAQGRVTRYTYTGRRSLASVERGGRVVRLRHDTEGRLVEVENEIGEVRRLTRDARGHVVRETDGCGAVTRYEYDGCGRLLRWIKPSGAAAHYQRDERGRVVAVRRSDGSADRFTYRTDGALMAAENDDSALRFERDLLGRVVEEQQGPHRITSRYEGARRAGLSCSVAGTRLDVQRGPLGDVEALALSGPASLFIRFTRDALGAEIGRELPGVALRWTRDALGRPEQREVRRGEASEARRYVWEHGLALAAIDDPGGRTRFTHDAAGRLESAVLPGGEVITRAPDAAGRVHGAADGSDRAYGPGGRLVEVDGVRHEYDADGQLRRKVLPDGREWRYTFDAAGMLREVLRPDATAVSFAYDPLGRRVRKTSGGATTSWVWDGDRMLHELPEGGAPVTWIHAPGGFTPIAKIDGGQRFAVVTDPIGTPEALHDEAGALAWQMQLDLHGVPREAGAARTACPVRYPGHYADEETGLHYNRFRYYDPRTGRYLSPDPLGLRGGIDPYAYVEDPLARMDPLGLIDDCDIDDVTRAMMDKNGLTQESLLYRTMDPQYLDEAAMTVAGNPNSMALVGDVYNEVPHPMLALLGPDDLANLPPSFPRTIPPKVDASDIGAGLNVAVSMPSTYDAAGNVTIAIRVGDVLDAGGRIYPDVGAIAQGIKPLYVTFDGSIPFRFFP